MLDASAVVVLGLPLLSIATGQRVFYPAIISVGCFGHPWGLPAVAGAGPPFTANA